MGGDKGGGGSISKEKLEFLEISNEDILCDDYVDLWFLFEYFVVLTQKFDFSTVSASCTYKSRDRMSCNLCDNTFWDGHIHLLS